MESKIKEKKAMLEVLEAVYSTIEYRMKDTRESIERAKDNLEQAENDETVRDWERMGWQQAIDDGHAWLKAAGEVAKALEKLI